MLPKPFGSIHCLLTSFCCSVPKSRKINGKKKEFKIVDFKNPYEISLDFLFLFLFLFFFLSFEMSLSLSVFILFLQFTLWWFDQARNWTNHQFFLSHGVSARCKFFFLTPSIGDKSGLPL